MSELQQITIPVKLHRNIQLEITPTECQQEAMRSLAELASKLDCVPKSPVAYRSLRAQIMRMAAEGLQPYFICKALSGVTTPELRSFVDATLAPLFQKAVQDEHEARERDGNLGTRSGKMRIPLGKSQKK
jgi:hypothetical protein